MLIRMLPCAQVHGIHTLHTLFQTGCLPVFKSMFKSDPKKATAVNVNVTDKVRGGYVKDGRRVERIRCGEDGRWSSAAHMS